jgi:hypothetical protein
MSYAFRTATAGFRIIQKAKELNPKGKIAQLGFYGSG